RALLRRDRGLLLDAARGRLNRVAAARVPDARASLLLLGHERDVDGADVAFCDLSPEAHEPAFATRLGLLVRQKAAARAGQPPVVVAADEAVPLVDVEPQHRAVHRRPGLSSVW